MTFLWKENISTRPNSSRLARGSAGSGDRVLEGPALVFTPEESSLGKLYLKREPASVGLTQTPSLLLMACYDAAAGFSPPQFQS